MKNYIPKNKHDHQAVKCLEAMPFEAFEADSMLLLEWLQDLHWPVALPIRNYLSAHINKITNELLYVLNSGDELWMYSILVLIWKSSEDVDERVLSIVKRFAENPTKDDIDNMFDYPAKAILARLEKSKG